jgi:outer membrane biosynthesis protein TonB
MRAALLAILAASAVALVAVSLFTLASVTGQSTNDVALASYPPPPTKTPTPTPKPKMTPTPTPKPKMTPTPTPKPKDKKITICHIPPGNPFNAHTITVGESAVQAHLDHGDYLGPCEPKKK